MHRPPSGVLPLFKPEGFTSNDVLAKFKGGLRKFMGRDVKVGHGGTLDLSATGILVVGINDGCKVLSHFLTGPKRYRALLKLGVETDSMDREGEVTHIDENKVYASADLDTVQNAILALKDKTLQTPPRFSALKLSGIRYSDINRKGSNIEPPPRPVNISHLSLTRSGAILAQQRATSSSSKLCTSSYSASELISPPITSPNPTHHRLATSPEIMDIEQLIGRSTASSVRPYSPSVWHDLMENALERGLVPKWATNLRPLAADEMEIEVECSSGTYVRVLASDLARSFGSYAHLLALTRVQSCGFTLANCLSPTEWFNIDQNPDLFFSTLCPPHLITATLQD